MTILRFKEKTKDIIIHVSDIYSTATSQTDCQHVLNDSLGER